MVVFSLAAAIGLSLAGQLRISREDADHRRFEQFSDDALSRVESRLELHLSLLYATRAFLAVEGTDLPVGDFRRYVAGIDIAERYAGIQGIGYAPIAAAGNDAATSDALAARYGRTVKVWPETTDQAQRTPITLLEPQDERNKAALGYDMFSDPVRRAAMEAAAKSGKPVASGPVRLVQEIDENRQFGFLVYLPVAPAGADASADPGADAGAGPGADAATGTAPGRPQGFVYAAFRIGDMLTAALFERPLLPIHVEVFDGAARPENMIFDSDESVSTNGPDYVAERRIDVAGRSWLLRISPTARFERWSSGHQSALLSALVLVLALALALLTLVQARRLEAVAALNREGERSLAQKDLLLREMNHRIKNSIARVLSIARQTARRSTDLDDFVERYSARLQAMSAAQEMLTRSKWSRAELRELLAAELDQVFGEDRHDYTLDGPALEVDETAAQALGLTFHEIATNAMKYGALSDPDGSLSVKWRKEADDVVIDWRETGGTKPDLAAARPGFGTRLIDMTIRGELRGSIERMVEGDLFAILIRFPFVDRPQQRPQPVPGARL
ncbi:CHASE domain-containing protein [Jiella sonneratiae]|uniref:histidine kinase n=1 Tax=Jiella sonneratiae TaxID=2816856 RepID=A0ABS3J0W0_9HYPH|nr:CHASE domain-containing protein [Jiella sonneratiae]